MTEKSYGGNNGVREHVGGTTKLKDSSNSKLITKKANKKIELKNIGADDKNENLDELESYKKAGKIAIEVREFAKKLIKPDMPLLEIARKIEAEIVKLGGGVGFPVNLSIDDVAAHYHPTIEDETKATGLLKVDIGVHVNGFIADSAFSLDLTPDKRYKDLIKSVEDALDNALDLLAENPSLSEIGNVIQKTISEKGFSAVVNLSGHELGQYNIHAGVTIPNNANNNSHKLDEGAYAIEPFATTGEGKVYDGPVSNIYSVVNAKNVRGDTAKKILDYVLDKYQTLPFSLREIQEKFGAMTRLGLKELEQNGIVHSYPQLIEKSHKPVAQAEHSFIKKDGKIIVFTR